MSLPLYDPTVLRVRQSDATECPCSPFLWFKEESPDWLGTSTMLDVLQRVKKTRTKFYTPAYEEWEAQYMPRPETVPAT